MKGLKYLIGYLLWQIAFKRVRLVKNAILPSIIQEGSEGFQRKTFVCSGHMPRNIFNHKIKSTCISNNQLPLQSRERGVGA